MMAQTAHPANGSLINDGSTDGAALSNVASARWIQPFTRQFIGAELCRGDSFNAARWSNGAVRRDREHRRGHCVRFSFFGFCAAIANDQTGVPAFPRGGCDSSRDSFEGENYVSGQCQLFRRACLEDVGGYVPNEAGGVDWIAVTTARMKGWKTRSFREKRFFHHRPLGTAERGRLSALYSYGQKDYYLGGSVIWEVFRVVYRMTKPPLLLGGLALGGGFVGAAALRMERPVSKELMEFHRREQMKVEGTLSAIAHLKKVDRFSVGKEQMPSKGAADQHRVMCGICGQYNFGTREPVDPQAVRQWRVLVHRG
jgi:hypothetical protein